MEYSAKHTMMVGPWGGDDGFYWDDGVYSAIRQLEIAHGAGIDSIKIEYDAKGKPVWSEKRGGLGGSKFDKVRLEYPNEYLTSLHGHYGSLQERGHALVRSLTFETNKRTYGPFGVEEGTHFSSKMHGKILGFVGKCGWYLNSIGAYIEPLQKPIISNLDHLHNSPIVSSPKYLPHRNEFPQSPLQKPVVSNLDHLYNSPIVSSPKYLPHRNEFPQSPLQKPVVSNLDHLHNSPIVSNPKYLPHHNEFSQSPENYEYSMIQGSLGKNIDLIVALRQRDEAKKSQPVYNHMSHDEPTTKEFARIVPSITEIVPPKNVKGVVKSLAWGGRGGSPFDDGVYDGIMQINVYRNVAISSIRVCYDHNGEPVWASKHGGRGSIWYDKIVIDYPSEKLSHISGYHGPTMIMGPTAIKSLTFHTTKDKYGPYGDEEGEFFTTKTNGGSIVLGFHGRNGLFVDAIGVHSVEDKVVSGPSSSNKDTTVSSISSSKHYPTIYPSKPIIHTTPPKSNSEWTFKVGRRGHAEEVDQQLVKSPAPYETGPWGGEGGKAWDDGVFSGIKQIIVTKTTDAICCIEIEYDRSGQSVWSVKHGGGGGQTANQVKLEHPNEVLTCISGYYGPIKKEQGTNVVQSLTFHTSRKKYGPFGQEVGTYFSSGTTEGKVVGFHGRSSSYLDAIGVHMPHWLGNQKGSKGSSLVKKIFY